MSKKKQQNDEWPVGRTIKAVRPMTKAEMKEQYWGDWESPPVVLILSDGSTLFPSRDPEGNGPGALFGKDPDGNGVALF